MIKVKLKLVSPLSTPDTAANAAFIAAQAALLKPALPKSGAYFAFAQKQLNYLLGDSGRSFVVGFGRNPPREPHHRYSKNSNSTKSSHKQ